MPPARSSVLDVLRAIAATLALTLAVGGLPGARLRVAPREVVVPPVPSDVKNREGSVDVTVREGTDGPPMAHVRVRALAILEDRAYLADARDTDGTGTVRLAGIPPGEVWLMADAPGRARGSTHFVLGAELRSVVLELMPGHAFDVAVKDEAGAPVMDGEVEVLSPADPLAVGARTGADGIAHVTRLGPAPWRVAARAPGYDEATGRAERDREVVTITLRKLSAILVHVIGPDDRPGAGARVAVAGATLWPARATEADAQGRVRIGGLGPGSYALRATLGATVSPIELGVTLGRGEEKAVDLRLAPGRFVAVRVTDGEGDDADSIAAARVTLVESGLSPFPIEATTDTKGRARLGPIAGGLATLDARAEGFVPRGTVPVPDPAPPETRMVLVRGGTLTGRVLDARGDPVDGATVEIAGTDLGGGPVFEDPRRANFQTAHFDAMLAGPVPLVQAGELGVVPGPVPAIPHAGASLSAPPWTSPPAPRAAAREVDPWVTRADGTFRAFPASPGRVRAIIHHPQYVEAQSNIVALAPGGEAHVEVVLHAGGDLEGRVLDAHDRAVAGAWVLVTATRGSLERTTRTASDGTFALAALPDALSLSVSVDDDDTPDVRMALSIPEGGRQQVTVRLPEPREPLPVTVIDERGQPVDAAQVTASSLSADAPLRTTVFTDARGQSHINKARGVPLRVEVRAPRRAPRVVVTEASLAALRVELTAGESAAGEVVTARGRDPIPAAEVTLYTDLGARHARTDAQGAFTLSDLAPGAAQLRISAKGYAPLSAAVAIPDSGGRRPYRIDRVEMIVEGVVEGDVSDAHGAPVAGARVARDRVPTWLLVGANPGGVAITDARGRFTLGGLPEGQVTLEAYAADLGRGHAAVTVVAGRTTDRVHLVIEALGDGGGGALEAPLAGGVAVTLGETGAPVEVVIVSVVEGSEAERAGLAPGDVIVAVDGVQVAAIEEARARLSGPIADDVVVSLRRGARSLAIRVAREAVRR